MSPLPAGPFPMAGVQMPTWILRYDKRGICTSPLTRAALVAELSGNTYTDVIAFSHGWNNDFDAAIALYREFLQRFEHAVAVHPPPRAFKPLFFGIVWPSTWLVLDDGPQIAAGGTVDQNDVPDAAVPGTAIDDIADRLADSSSAPEIERFFALVQADRLDATEAHELAKIVAPAFAGFADDENQDGDRTLEADDVLRILRDLEPAESRNGAAPLDVDDFGGVGGPGAAPTAAGFLDALDPRRVVRLFSVYQMKDRAGAVGTRGMAPLLRSVLAATTSRVHAVGHSYGCKVQLSAICEATPLPRPIDSLLLLQPAVSHLCFAARVPGTNRAGGYRPALDSARVRQPILSTFSRADFPLHETFHLALRREDDLGEMQIAAGATTAGDPPSRYAALGGYGPRGAGQSLVDPMPGIGDGYPALGSAPIFGLDGSRGLVKGHGDVRTDATAWALHQLVFRGA